jgi:hypothetical protein
MLRRRRIRSSQLPVAVYFSQHVYIPRAQPLQYCIQPCFVQFNGGSGSVFL